MCLRKQPIIHFAKTQLMMRDEHQMKSKSTALEAALLQSETREQSLEMYSSLGLRAVQLNCPSP
jgi:hypothetical protein